MEANELHKEDTDKYSLTGRVFHKLREDILSGKYVHNDELKENTIAIELGVSRTPVREALRQLELEGLISIIPNRGAFVTGISEKDIHDIYVIRSYLEGLCARWECENITNDVIIELEEIIYLTDFHIQKGNSEQILELDNKFHETVYQASNSKILDHVLSDFHQYVQRVQKISLSDSERAEKLNQEHKAIVEALRNKNGKEAERLAHEHIIQTIFSHHTKGL